MNLVKAKVTAGKSAGRVVWVDIDSKLTHWCGSGGVDITTYKAYFLSFAPLPPREKIGSSDFWARISEKNLTFIEDQNEEEKQQNKTSLFNDIINQYGGELMFSVVDENDGERMLENATFSQCKEFVKDREEDPYELCITITIMKSFKILKPTI